MYLQKKSITRFVFALICSAGLLFSQLSFVYAQEEIVNNSEQETPASSPPSLQCPIVGTIGATFVDNEENASQNFFSNEIIVTNQSVFALSGVRVAVVAFDTEGNPAYWTVLPGVLQLPPGQSIKIPVDLDLSFVAPGTYTLKPSIVQGTEAELIGASIRDYENQSGINIEKVTPKEKDVSIAVSINGEAISSEIGVTKTDTVAVKIETTNNDKTGLVEGHMVGVITEGSAPLGSALISEVTDSVKLLPGTTRETLLNMNGSDYHDLTLYAGLVTEGVLQPIKTIKIKTDAEEFTGVWPYISRLGVSSVPPKAGTAVVACTDYLGLDSRTAYSPLAVDFELSVGEDSVAKKRITNLDGNIGRTFTLILDKDLLDFNISATLLQYDSRGGLKPVSEYESLEAHIRDNFYEARKTEVEFVCDNPNLCSPVVEATEIPVENKESNQNNIWFFVAGIAVVALVIYLMILGFPPKNKKPDQDDGDYDTNK